MQINSKMHNSNVKRLVRTQAKKCKDFLQDWANLPNHGGYPRPSSWDEGPWHDAANRLTSRYPEMFKFVAKEERALDLVLGEGQRWLRMAWNEKGDPRKREWYLFLTRYTYHNKRVTIELADSFPGSDVKEKRRFFSHMIPGYKMTLLDAAIHHVQTRLDHRMQCCPSLACPARYFFKRRKKQTYCSVACERSTRKSQRRRWWNENRGTRQRKTPA
jgi:hypothetical protein